MLRSNFYILIICLLARFAIGFPSIHETYDYDYGGCYAETSRNINYRALKGHSHRNSRMTVEWCLEQCYDGGHRQKYAYAGLEFGRECWCSNGLKRNSVQLGNETCDYPCGGNGTQFCGGSMAISLYKRPEAAGTKSSVPLMGSFLGVGMVIGFLFFGF